MNKAYAHTQVYDHKHPHVFDHHTLDAIGLLFWLVTIVMLLILIFSVLRYYGGK